MKTKQKILLEIIILVLLYILVSIYLSVSYYIKTQYWHYDHYSLELAIMIFGIYNFIRVLLLKGKSVYLKRMGFEILQFIVINIVLTFLVSLFIWITRDEKLIEVTKLYEYTFFAICLIMLFHLLVVGYVLVLAFNSKKLFCINKEIYIRLFPLKISIFLLLLMFSNGNEMLCPWNPLIDTRHSKTFNIYNIDKIENGMAKEEIINLIGEPLDSIKDTGWIDWTGDGKSYRGDYEWFSILIKFVDGIMTEKNVYWMDD